MNKQSPVQMKRFEYNQCGNTVNQYAVPERVCVTQRLKNVQAYAGAALVRDYRLAYGASPAGGRSRLTSLTECDGAGDCFPATTFTWADGTAGLDVAGWKTRTVNGPNWKSRL